MQVVKEFDVCLGLDQIFQCLTMTPEAGRTAAVTSRGHGGKSGLHRAGCQVTPGRREPTESAAENIPPALRRR